MLARLRIRTKLALLLGLFTIGLVAISAVDASRMYQRMYDDRIDKLKAAVDMTWSIAAALEDQVAKGEATREEQFAKLRDVMHRMRFDGGDGYLVLQRFSDGHVLVHGTRPDVEGKSGQAKDADGRPLIDLQRQALKNADSATITYVFPKPGEEEPQPKVAYIRRFPPIGGMFLAGAYTDDLDREFRGQMTWTVAGGIGILTLIVLLTWLVSRDITAPLGRLSRAMAALSNGELGTDIPDAGRHDEVGQMAAAVQVFKDKAAEVERLKAEQQDAERHAAEEKHRAMAALADAFEASVGAIVDGLAAAASEMEANAAAMSETADQTSQRATAVAAASEQASMNVQSAAGAAEELSSSVAEISRQVASSSEIAGKAADESSRTNALVNGLAEAAQKIGDVTSLINDIAAQTNLLALNATIEAARAGEAGKGFAVVASEVKNLASQTAKATEEISGQIAAMQNVTGDAVEAIRSIGTTIGQLNEIATAIAAAVDEQDAATHGIAGNLQQAATGTTEVSSNITGVSQALGETGTAAGQVLDAAGRLSRQAATLRGEVDRFLAQVRAV